MFLDIRKRIFLIVFLVILFFVLAYFILRQPKAAQEPVEQETQVTQDEPAKNDEPVISDVIIRTPPPPPPANSEEREKLFMVQLSKIFTERYLSYSNQNNNGNFNDIKPIVTEKFLSYLETKKVVFDQNYKGVSTKVISSSLEKFDGQTASVKIGIQQYAEEEGKNPVTTYKNGTVTLEKQEKDWKVSGLYLE